MTNATKKNLEQATRLAERAMRLHETRGARANATPAVKSKMRAVRIVLGRI